MTTRRRWSTRPTTRPSGPSRSTPAPTTLGRPGDPAQGAAPGDPGVGKPQHRSAWPVLGPGGHHRHVDRRVRLLRPGPGPRRAGLSEPHRGVRERRGGGQQRQLHRPDPPHARPRTRGRRTARSRSPSPTPTARRAAAPRWSSAPTPIRRPHQIRREPHRTHPGTTPTHASSARMGSAAHRSASTPTTPAPHWPRQGRRSRSPRPGSRSRLPRTRRPRSMRPRRTSPTTPRPAPPPTPPTSRIRSRQT